MDLLSFRCLCLLPQLHFMGYISDKHQWVYNAIAFTKPFPGHHLRQPSLTFLETGTSWVEDNFFHEPGGRGRFWDDSSTLHLLCTLLLWILLLYQLHLRSSGEIPEVGDPWSRVMKNPPFSFQIQEVRVQWASETRLGTHCWSRQILTQGCTAYHYGKLASLSIKWLIYYFTYDLSI